jgi:ABC-type nitrate/sulfonate/bicarbonate transport system substrate-binding protein
VRSSTRRTILWALALVAALVVVGVAFVQTDDGEGAVPPPPSPSPRVPADPGPGCGDDAVTDVADLSVGRTLARCAPDAPAPDPVTTGEPETVRVALTDRTEAAAPLLVADALGEFEAEGLDVEVVDRPRDEAYAALAEGEVDVVVGGIDARFFDAVHGGLEARLVLGGEVARDPSDLEQAQTGLWLRADLITRDGRDWENVKGQTVLVPGGQRSAAVYPIDTLLGQQQLEANAIDIRPSGEAGAATRLLAADVGGAWLTEPGATEVAADESLTLVATVPGSEAIDGTVFGPRILDDGRAIGEAYARAVVRTINTHLADGYDDEALGVVSEALDVDEDAVDAGPDPLFDWEIRAGTSRRIQDTMTVVGAVGYESPLPESAVVDRSFVGAAVDQPDG